MAENLNNVTHEKEEENIGNLRKRSFFSSIMKTVALITLDFISRDMNKDDMIKTLLEFALNPLVLGENGPKSWKKNFNVIFSETCFCTATSPFP